MLFGGEHIKVDFGGSKVLAEAIVQFPCDSAALFILHSHQTRGKQPQCRSALLDLALKDIVSAAQGLLGGFTFAEMIANLILPLSCYKGRAHCTGEGCRAERPLQKRNVAERST
jgi:hypothetical protein